MDARPPSHPENIAGLVERVTFFNEENGYCVLRVKVKGHRDLVTVVGSLPSANAGEWVTAEGQWVQDREFGRQFRAVLLKSSPPTTLEGIEKYLGSGMVKGIGPIYAKKLVQKFGDGIFEVIEQRSALLEDVDGIGPKRRLKIKGAWAEQKVVRQIMLFLHSHGVSTSRAVRIFKLYGADAVERVQLNPYGLARDIPGIGFHTADQIAQKVGIPAESILRAGAGLSHVLLEATSDGHCALPREALLKAAVELLKVPEANVAEALAKALAEEELVLDEIVGEAWVFLPWLRQSEIGVARRILALTRQPSTYPAIDLEKAAVWCQGVTGKALAPSQMNAFREALSRRCLIITGGPGVGKTTLVNSILRVLLAKKVRCLLCAPTGRAAKRMTETTGLEARTIHRLLEAKGAGGKFLRDDKNPIECDLLVVDETSMVDVGLMNQLLRAVPSNAHVLLVGDVDQLPSVGPGHVLKHLIDSDCVPVVRLTEVFRQAAESRIITNAHRINSGQIPEAPTKEEISDFYWIEREEPERISETIVEVVSRRIPSRFGMDPIRDIQVLCPMNRGSLGMRAMNLVLQDALNPASADQPVVEKFGWRFRVRDKVIQTENNYDKDVFNGDIGQIQSIDAVEHEVTVRFDGREVVYDFGELDELALAYAITIHKSQGSEFPVVVIPLATQQYLLLQRNLLYTGVTRGKRLVVLVGQTKALSMAVRNHETQRRYSALLHRLRNAAAAPTGDWS